MQTADDSDNARLSAAEVRSVRVVTAVAWAIGIFATLLSVRSFLLNADNSDFASFYESAVAWRRGASPYMSDWRVNLNPPLMLWVFAPFTAWPLATAAWAWMALQFIVLVVLIELTARELALAPPHGALARGLMLTVLAPTVALAQLIREGQWVLGLALLVTLTWRLSRRGQPAGAAALLGVAIALKPFTWWLWLALPGPFTARVLAAGAAGLSATVLASYLTGPDLFRQWLDLGGTLTAGHLTHWLNVSLPGHLNRTMGLSWMAGTLIATGVMLAVFWWRAITRRALRTDDATWWLASLATVLAAPLGWAYYVMLGVGPAVAHLISQGRPTPLFGAGWIALLAVWISAVPLTWCTWIWTAGVLCWTAEALRSRPTSSA